MKIGTKVIVGWKMKKYDNQFRTRQGVIDEASKFYTAKNGDECLSFLTEDGYRTAVNYTITVIKKGV